MSTTSDTEPAIPLTAMTLRDHFAACAIQPLVAKIAAVAPLPLAHFKAAAGAAYELADAMLAERAKGGAK